MISSLLFLCVLLYAAFPLAAQKPPTTAAKSSVLKDIQVVYSSSGIEVRIILAGLTSHKAFELSSPTRLILDLSGIEKVAAAPEITIGAGGIRRVRSGLFSKDTGRVVFDMDGKMPRYEIVKIAEGLKVTFAPAVQPVQKDETKPVSAKDDRAKPDPAKPKVEEQPPAADKRQMEETKRALEQEIKPYDKSIQENPDRKRRSIRVMAAGSLFFPGQGGLKDRYGSGLKIGAEINSGIADMIEIWLSVSSLNQTSTDPATGDDRRSGLFPVLAGLKFKLTKDFVNYYLGFGAGYFFYSETSAAGTNHELEFGLTGQAGLFLKLGRNFVLGAQAQYDHCRMGSGAGRINPGGFHIGLCAGAEF